VWRNADRRAQILLGLLVVVLYADILFAGRGFFLLDITSYHIPMKWVVRDILLHGELPLWNRAYSAGQPLAANPAYLNLAADVRMAFFAELPQPRGGTS